MNAPASSAEIGAHCLRGGHARCLIPKVCACDCHQTEPPKPPAVVTQIRPTDCWNEPNRAGKYKPVIGLEWGDPPPVLKPKTQSIIADLVPELKRHPGQWAKVGTWKSPNSAATAANPLRKAHPDIEFTSRRAADGGSALYARAREDDGG